MKYIRITVNTPKADVEKVLEALGKAGAGKIDKYGNCSFTVLGTGRALPLEGANPHIGQVGKLEEVEEEQIQTFCREEDLEKVIKALKKAHPYEEPLITYWPVEIE